MVDQPSMRPEALRKAPVQVECLAHQPCVLLERSSEPIAIVGINVSRFPGRVDSPEAGLWQMQGRRQDDVEFPTDRGWIWPGCST